MRRIALYAGRCVVVCMLCFVQLLCVNSDVSWLMYTHVGLVALVVAVLSDAPFFWCLLIGYPLILSWYSGLPIFLGSWVFAVIAVVLWFIREFFVKEQFFLVRFGFLVIATVLWPILEKVGSLIASGFGYHVLPSESLWSIVGHTGVALIVHTVLLALFTVFEHAVYKKNPYVA